MGKIDVVTKEYVRNPQVFADICNWALGTDLQPEQLIEVDGTMSVVLTDKEEGKSKDFQQRYRDAMKRAVVMEASGATIAIFGIENQREVDYSMVVRNMLYDSMTYSRQVKIVNAQNIAKGLVSPKAPEYKRLRKDDKLKPVITIVMYWGAEKWDGARSLYELLDFTECEKLKEYISNYKMTLIVPAEIDDFEGFSSKLRYVLPIIKNSKSKYRMKELLEKHKAVYSDLDFETATVIGTVANIDVPKRKEGENVDMCKAWDDHYRDGIEEGRAEGRSEIILRLLGKGKTNSEIIELIGVSEEDIERAREEAPQPV